MSRTAKTAETIRTELEAANARLEAQLELPKAKMDVAELTDAAGLVKTLQTALDNKTADERAEAAMGGIREFRDAMREAVLAVLAVEDEDGNPQFETVWAGISHVTISRGETGPLFSVKPVGNRSRAITDAKLDGVDLENGDDAEGESEADAA